MAKIKAYISSTDCGDGTQTISIFPDKQTAAKKYGISEEELEENMLLNEIFLEIEGINGEYCLSKQTSINLYSC